jgi:hypothetical protein
MIDSLKYFYYQYYNQFMAWYSAADDVVQIAVVVTSGLVILSLLAIIFLSKLTKC